MDAIKNNPIVMIVAAVLAVALIGYFGFRSSEPAQPPVGSYTPGVPPWQDKKSADFGKAQAPPSAGKPAEPVPSGSAR